MRYVNIPLDDKEHPKKVFNKFGFLVPVSELRRIAERNPNVAVSHNPRRGNGIFTYEHENLVEK